MRNRCADAEDRPAGHTHWMEATPFDHTEESGPLNRLFAGFTGPCDVDHSPLPGVGPIAFAPT